MRNIGKSQFKSKTDIGDKKKKFNRLKDALYNAFEENKGRWRQREASIFIDNLIRCSKCDSATGTMYKHKDNNIYCYACHNDSKEESIEEISNLKEK